MFLARNSRLRASNTLRVVLRSDDPAASVDRLRVAITTVLPRSPRIVIETGRDLVERDLGRERLGAWFFSGLGVVAVGVGLGGVFGLIAYLAESRRREFGVRIALGATSANLVRVAVGSGLIPVMIGTGIGLLGAAWLAKTAQSFLIGVSALDSVSYAGVALMLVAGATAAGLTAAWRLRSISPVEALRAE
jgi:ABC-type antimicrobial peptide transport system permease subunit